MAKKLKNPWNDLREVVLWFLKKLWIVTVGVAFLMLLVAGGIVWYASSIATVHEFRKDLLLNVAAGFLEIGIGTLIVAFVGWVVAISRFQLLAKPLLKFIQQLRIDNKLTPELARKSVIVAVALLSENNVSKGLAPDTGEHRDYCSVCSLDVRNEKERCSHCNLPRAVWTDPELVEGSQIVTK